MSNDLISREATVSILRAKADITIGEVKDAASFFNHCANMIEKLPAVDAEPVRHGKWVCHEDDIMSWYECSLCGCEAFDVHGANYCPNCGAKMDLEDDDE